MSRPMTRGSFSSSSETLRRFARRAVCRCDSSLLCWSWMVENSRRARSCPASKQ